MYICNFDRGIISLCFNGAYLHVFSLIAKIEKIYQIIGKVLGGLIGCQLQDCVKEREVEEGSMRKLVTFGVISWWRPHLAGT